MCLKTYCPNCDKECTPEPYSSDNEAFIICDFCEQEIQIGELMVKSKEILKAREHRE